MKFLILFACLIPFIAQAKIFRNAYVAFELPANWNCVLEQTEWVCRSQTTDESKQAIIILTAKEVGPTDSFDLYQNHLSASKDAITKSGQKISSKVLHAKPVQINNQKWIDGWHLSSEIPNYYTRYLATLKEKIAILVTFSAHKLYYTKYSQDFFKAIMSLRVVASHGLLTRPTGDIVRPGNETLGANIGAAIPNDMMSGEELPAEDAAEKGKTSMNDILLALALILIAGGLLLYMRKRRKS